MEVQPQPYAGFEQRLNQSMGRLPRDKTFADKVLADKEIISIKELIGKPEIDASELRQLNYLLSGKEAKLLNYDTRDRYILGKYLTWVRRYSTLLETHLKNLEVLKKVGIGKKKPTPRTNLANERVREVLTDDFKYLVNMFLFFSRTSLSIKGAAFKTLNTETHEYQYIQPTQLTTQPNQQGRR